MHYPSPLTYQRKLCKATTCMCCKCSSCGTDLINKSATHPSNKGEQQSSYWWGRAGQSLASEAAWLSV